jgi:hypothetical protein
MSAAMSAQGAARSFDPLRPRLIRVAYRRLGSVADAEDIVQEAFPRWLDADPDAVWLGAGAQSNTDQGRELAPPEEDLATARHLGRRVAEATLNFVRGRTATAAHHAHALRVAQP